MSAKKTAEEWAAVQADATWKAAAKAAEKARSALWIAEGRMWKAFKAWEKKKTATEKAKKR